jgi:hypothetical protein
VSCDGTVRCAGHFPEAEHDPIIQIANVVTVQVGGALAFRATAYVSLLYSARTLDGGLFWQGASSATIRNVMVLGETSSIVGASVICFEKEEALVS